MSDYIVRAVAANAQIRAFACTTSKLTEHARQIHNTSPVVTAALGRLMSAGLMMGAMLKNESDLITLQIKGDGPMGGMTVTADARGKVKGYANVPDVIIPAKKNGKLDVSGAVGNGMLTVIKDMGLKEPYSGQIELQTGEIAEDITYYFAASEQVPSSVGLGVLMEKDNTVRQAGGFIVQLMPFAGEDVIERLERNLQGFTSVTQVLDSGSTPEQMLSLLLDGLDVEFSDRISACYECGCSREKIERVLISVGKSELQSMIDDAKDIEVNCHFCNTDYRFSVEELKELLKRAQ